MDRGLDAEALKQLVSAPTISAKKKKKVNKNVTFKEMAKTIEDYLEPIQNWNKGSGVTISLDMLLANKRKAAWYWPEGDETLFKKELKKLLDSELYTVSSVGFGYSEYTHVDVSITFKRP